MQLKLGTIGETIKGLEDIKQEIYLILSTPLGSIPHRPEFGSRIYEYLDKPIELVRHLIIAETYRALKANSNRFYPTKVILLEATSEGKLIFKITGIITDSQTEQEIVLEFLADFAR